MAKPLSVLSVAILKTLNSGQALMLHDLQVAHAQGKNKKTVYDTLYRLGGQGLVELGKGGYGITPEGTKLIHNYFPQRDGIWKLIIFDIPEKKRVVRTFLRQRLQALHFKKWQNSIWVSPYRLDDELEQELLLLAQKYFVRLIKTTDVNYDKDLQKLFPDVS